MSRPRTLVLTGFGINCDYETEQAFEAAGSEAARMHVNDLIESPERLEDFQILAVPGGFSFGDDIASGKVLANKLRYRLGESFLRFVDSDRLVLGICNGFQVLVRLGVLPDGRVGMERQRASLTYNDSGRFEDRWVSLETCENSPCVFTRGLGRFDLPVRHGEGKFIVESPEALAGLEQNGQVVLRYVAPDGGPAEYPFNPNGSPADVAGVCDPSGRIFGLMPHPEAFVTRLQHPRWTSIEMPEEGAGLAVFRNAVEYFN